MKYIKFRKLKYNLTFSKRATEVLYTKMDFYDTKAKALLKKIMEALNSQEKARGDLATYIYKQFHEANKLAIECATKLAPYQSPKLETVEVKKKVHHQFVIRAPSTPRTKEQWMNEVGATNIESEQTIKQIAREVNREIREEMNVDEDQQRILNRIREEDSEEDENSIIEEERKTLLQ